MADLIQSLDDATAQWVLERIVRPGPAVAGSEMAWSPEVKEALEKEFQVSEGSGAADGISKGELARQALAVLAEDPEKKVAIERAVAAGPPAKAFDFGIGLTLAVLLVLQTRMQFSADSTGKWSVKFDKKAAGASEVKGLVQKLVGFVG
jgi:hypothetical protein